jgi:hypothetical protein
MARRRKQPTKAQLDAEAQIRAAKETMRRLVMEEQIGLGPKWLPSAARLAALHSPLHERKRVRAASATARLVGRGEIRASAKVRKKKAGGAPRVACETELIAMIKDKKNSAASSKAISRWLELKGHKVHPSTVWRRQKEIREGKI